jgi:hypothetical protein
MKQIKFYALLLAFVTLSCNNTATKPSEDNNNQNIEIADPLPSWNTGATKTAIVDFVTKVTSEGPDFIPVEDRIATFDNDGNLWAEQPAYFQLFFAMDRIKDLVSEHP